MAQTAIPPTVPLDSAVWRLRSRGCWQDAAALLEHAAALSPTAALRRTALLVECCMFTGEGWERAEDALRAVESMALTDEERGRRPASAAIWRTHRRYCGCATGPMRRGPRWAGRRRCWPPIRRAGRCWTSGAD